MKVAAVAVHAHEPGGGGWVACDCPVEAAARQYVATLDIPAAYLEPRYDRCYCERCYPANRPNTIPNEGPTEYVVPRGWFRFGLKLPPKAEALNIFGAWSVSFHGT